MRPAYLLRCAANTPPPGEPAKPTPGFLKSLAAWIRQDTFDEEGLRTIMDVYRSQESTKPAKGVSLWYGIPEGAREKILFQSIGDHTFKLCPVRYPKSDVVRSQLYRYYAGAKIPLTIEKIESTRALVNGMSNKEKMTFLACAAQVESQFLSQAFQSPKSGVNYAAFERMLYPKYLPSFREATGTFRLPTQWRYSPEDFLTLENIARYPLDRVDQMKGDTVSLSFEEWHSLLFNYHLPITPLQYYFLTTDTSILYTREFIDEFAEYLRQRCRRIGPKAQPIVDVMSSNGRLAYHLNQTGRIPVPVIPCHEKPNRNFYLMKIPRDVQSEFELPAPRALDVAKALAEYRPNIVICQDMPKLKDLSRQFRAEGSVCEYILMGVPMSYICGHPWYTWGITGNKPKDDKSTKPHHVASGFRMRQLNHISRWLIERHDSNVATGFGQVVSFVKNTAAHSLGERLRHAFARVQKF